MAENLGEAILRLATDSRDLKKGLKNARELVKDHAQDLTNVGKDLSAKVSLPIIAFGGFAIKASGDFELAMNTVAAVSGATEEQLEELTEQAKQLGATTQFSASQAADGMGFLARAGFEVNEILGAMPKVLELSAASQMSLGDTADVVSNILAGYNLEVKDLVRVNDVLVKAFTSSNTNLQQLGEAMKFAGPIASAAGVRFEEAAAALGLMGNAGIQASMAGTSLRGAISRILSPTAEATRRMNELGLNFTDSQGRLISFTEIVQQLEPHVEDAGLFLELFGQRAGPAMAALVAQGSKELTEFTALLQKSGGTAQTIAEVQMAGFNGAMKEMVSAFEAVQIALGESGLLDFMSSLARLIASVLRGLASLNPKILAFGTAMAGLAAILGPALIILGQLTIAVKALIPLFPLLKAGMVALFTGAGAPFLLLAGAVVIWIANWETLKRDTMIIVNFLIEGIANSFTMMKDRVVQIVTNLKDTTIRKFKEMFNTLVGNSIVPDMNERIVDDFEEMSEDSLEAITISTNGMVEQFGDTLGSVASELVQGKATMQDFSNAIINSIIRIIAQLVALKAASAFLGGFGGGFIGGFATFGGTASLGGPAPTSGLAAVGGGGRSSITIQNNIEGADFANEETINRILTGITGATRRGVSESIDASNAMFDSANINRRRAT